LAAFEQIIQAFAVDYRQRIGQRHIDAPVCAGGSFGADSLDDIQRRQQYALLAQTFNQRGGQHDALVGLLSQIVQTVNAWAVVLSRKWLETEDRMQFE